MTASTFWRQNSRLIWNAIAVCGVVGVAVLVYRGTASQREADRVSQELTEADRQAVSGLTPDGRLVYAAGRPQTQEGALAALAKRDASWTKWPAVAEAVKLLAPDLERGTRDQKLAILKLLNQLGPVGADVASVARAVADSDPAVRAVARETLAKVGIDLSAKSDRHSALLGQLVRQVEASGDDRLPEAELTATIRVLGRFKSNGGAAVAVLTQVESGDHPRAVSRAARASLDAIDPTWVDRTDQRKLLTRIVADLTHGGQEATETVVELLPRLGQLKVDALPEVVPLTCHPSELLRDEAWKALSWVAAAANDPLAEGEAVIQKLPDLLNWAAKADTAEAGGQLLAQSIGLCILTPERRPIGKLLLAVATGPARTREVALVAIDQLAKGWRESAQYRSLVTKLEYLHEHQTPWAYDLSAEPFAQLIEEFMKSGKAAADRVAYADRFEVAWEGHKKTLRHSRLDEKYSEYAAYLEQEKAKFKLDYDYRMRAKPLYSPPMIIPPSERDDKPTPPVMSKAAQTAYTKAFRERITTFLGQVKKAK